MWEEIRATLFEINPSNDQVTKSWTLTTVSHKGTLTAELSCYSVVDVTSAICYPKDLLQDWFISYRFDDDITIAAIGNPHLTTTL